MKPFTFHRIVHPIFILTLAFFSVKMNGQIVIGTPNLEFSQACANESFNSFTVSFVFSPEEGLAANNQFILEMSDAEGDFSEAINVYTSSPGEITTSPASISFALPNETAGEAYKIRIKSTQPVASSVASESFSAYYKLHDTPFTINNLIPSATYCPGGSYLLTIDNPGTGNNSSPLNFPSLTFNWFKVVDPTTSTFVVQSPSLSVTEPGTYYVETNYGTCTSNSFSNRVSVSEATSGDEVTATITSSEGNPFCGADTPTTLSTVEGDSYQWYLEGVPISGATQQTFETNSSGEYSVIVRFGSCQATGVILLDSGDFTSSIDVPSEVMLETGSSIEVTVSTTAIDPEFQWFLNSEPIPNATQSSYTVSTFGSFTVFITQTDNCIITKEHVFLVQELVDQFPDVANIPNVISPNGDGINDTWVLPTDYVSGTNTEVVIYSNTGEIVFKTSNYTNNWPEDQLSKSGINQVFYYSITPPGAEPKRGSITVFK